MTRYLAAELAKDHYFNTARARDELGFVPAISGEQGRRRVVVIRR